MEDQQTIPSLRAYHATLCEWYQIGYLQSKLPGQFHFSDSLLGLRSQMEGCMDQENRSNGPGDIWSHLYSWLYVCANLTNEERIKLVKTFFESVDLSAMKTSENMIIQALIGLQAKSSIWRLADRFFVVDDNASVDPIWELKQSSTNEGVLVNRTSDMVLRGCLIPSWKYSTHDTAYLAREWLIRDFWSAWETHLAHARRSFNQFAFIADGRLGALMTSGRSLYNLAVWEDVPFVLLLDSDRNMLTQIVRKQYFCDTDIIKSTQKLCGWIQERQDLGYVGLAEYAGFPDQRMSEKVLCRLRDPLSTGNHRGKFARLTLEEAISSGCHELGLKQAVFGGVLITHPECIRQSSSVSDS
jgi:hypothetical protein